MSPMLGLNFGGVSGCPGLRDCTNNQKDFSIAAGKFGAIFGAEAEVALSPDFFGLLSTNDTSLGYAVGGGVFALVGDRFGVRGDLRYIHSFPDVIVQGVTLPSTKLNYSRISGGLVIQF